MRTRTVISAALCSFAAAVAAASSEVRTFCNPISIEDYPVGLFCRGLANGSKPAREPETWLTVDGKTVQFRELADPSIICEKGIWYIYPSGDLCYKSTDMGATWSHVPLRLSGAEGGKDQIGYAPTICKHRGKFLLVGGTGHVFQSDSPEGPFTDLGPLELPKWKNWNFNGDPPGLWDPNYFSDDDGRLYFYWGCTPTNGIWGIEIDPANPLRTISEAKRLVPFEPRTQPWEIAPGKHPEMGYLEGAWMVKHDGRYILTYAAAGTENKEYAMGQAVSSSPLGPFTKPKNNPFFRKTEGFITGTSHGSIAQGPDGDWYVAYTINANCVHWFERRIGFDRISFAPDGTIAPSSATDEPQWLPRFGKGAAGWKRLVALTEPGREAATDQKFGTFWRAERLPATIRVDFAGAKIMRSCRVIWRDCGLDVERGVRPGAFQYRVEALAADGKWRTVVDASQNRRDLLVDYRETEPVKATAARLVVLGAPKGIVPGVVDFSPFGD